MVLKLPDLNPAENVQVVVKLDLQNTCKRSNFVIRTKEFTKLKLNTFKIAESFVFESKGLLNLKVIKQASNY